MSLQVVVQPGALAAGTLLLLLLPPAGKAFFNASDRRSNQPAVRTHTHTHTHTQSRISEHELATFKALTAGCC